MKRKRILFDPSFWILAIVNGYLVYRFYRQPEIFITLIWLYWSQGILLGVFTILDLLTVKDTTPITYTVNKVFTAMKDGKSSRWSSAKAFFFIYGILHLIYFLFLLSMKRGAPPIQWDLFKYFFFAFLIGQVINFIQHKIQQRRQATDTGPIIFTPFIRVLPMHLTIIFAGFFPAASIGFFLIIKSLADVGMYVATKPAIKSREADTASLAAEQNINLNM